jgi:hypothetical protein
MNGLALKVAKQNVNISGILLVLVLALVACKPATQATKVAQAQSDGLINAEVYAGLTPSQRKIYAAYPLEKKQLISRMPKEMQASPIQQQEAQEQVLH